MNFALAALIIALTGPFWVWQARECIDWWDHRHDHDVAWQVRTNPDRRALRAFRR